MKKSSNQFTKNTNDYLNFFITVSDAKSVAILGLNFLILGHLADIQPQSNVLCLYIISGIASVISIVISCFVIYPRLNKPEKGSVFWENIKQFKNFDEYYSSTKISEKNICKAYAEQNWYISKILSIKNKLIRVSIIIFIISLLTLLFYTFFD